MMRAYMFHLVCITRSACGLMFRSPCAIRFISYEAIRIIPYLRSERQECDASPNVKDVIEIVFRFIPKSNMRLDEWTKNINDPALYNLEYSGIKKTGSLIYCYIIERASR